MVSGSNTRAPKTHNHCYRCTIFLATVKGVRLHHRGRLRPPPKGGASMRRPLSNDGARAAIFRRCSAAAFFYLGTSPGNYCATCASAPPAASLSIQATSISYSPIPRSSRSQPLHTGEKSPLRALRTFTSRGVYPHCYVAAGGAVTSGGFWAASLDLSLITGVCFVSLAPVSALYSSNVFIPFGSFLILSVALSFIS